MWKKNEKWLRCKLDQRKRVSLIAMNQRNKQRNIKTF